MRLRPKAGALNRKSSGTDIEHHVGIPVGMRGIGKRVNCGPQVLKYLWDLADHIRISPHCRKRLASSIGLNGFRRPQLSIEFDAHLGKTTRVEGGTYRRDWCIVREDSNRALC